MTKVQFKKRWDSNEDSRGITFDDIAQCAVDWVLVQNPRIHRIDIIANMVTKAAGCKYVYPVDDVTKDGDSV